VNRRYSHMLTRGVNEIQVYVYIRTFKSCYSIIKKGGLLWQDSHGVVVVAGHMDGVNQEPASNVPITFPVVVYVCKKSVFS